MNNVKAKIIELVPDVILYVQAGNYKYRPITLADVLRAIEKVPQEATLFIDCKGQWYGMNTKLKLAESGYIHRDKNWNLTQDYEGQTDEVKQFIGTLLGVNTN